MKVQPTHCARSDVEPTPRVALQTATLISPRRATLKQRFPWWGKVAAKIVIARLPVSYGAWKRLGIFDHGAMEDPAYAIRVFRHHFARYSNRHPGRGPFTALEVGPGNSLVSSVVACAFGAEKTFLVDEGDFRTAPIGTYCRAAQQLLDAGLPAPRLDTSMHITQILCRSGGVYLTHGLESLASIPDGSVDFIWSQAVLEHIRRAQLPATLAELRRIMAHDGVASHTVDLMDHLDERLNNLRFAEKTWESNFLAASGFYTNRVRYAEFCQLLREAGFAVAVSNVHAWETVPTPRSRMAPAYRCLSPDELRIASFDVTLTQPEGQRSS